MAADGHPDDGQQDPDPPLGEIPEFDRGELQSDTLEFERVKRRRPNRRRGILIILVFLALAAGSYSAWLTMGEELFGKNPYTIPVVRAGAGPVKVRPAKPGGIEIKNRDIEVYNRIGGDQPERSAEKLLPEPEAPLPAPDRPGNEKKLMEAIPKEAEKLIADSTPPTDTNARPSLEKVAALKEPPPPLEVKGKTTTPPQSNLELRPQAKQGDNTLAQKAAPTKPPTRSGSPAPLPAAAEYSVQLAAVRDENAARGEWRRLRGRHMELLGELSLNVVRADLGTKGVFFRLRAGNLADKAAAQTLCESLAKKKVGCLVVPPGG